MLTDKTAVITGGTTGIGRALASKYVEYGASVVIAARSEDTGHEVAAELGCQFTRCDVTDYEQVKAVVEGTVEEFGHLDVIVNNAGIGRTGTLEEMTLEDWQRVIQVDLTGVMHGARAALPHLKERDGSIINVASIFGLVGGPGAAAYSAAKGGVVNLTRQLAVDYASEDVRVNSICPGFVKTPMTEDLLGDNQFYDFVRGQTPLGRVAEPEEIGGLAVYLASDEASYVTGANIPVDGGWTAR